MSVQPHQLIRRGIINSDSKGAVIMPPIIGAESGSSPLNQPPFPTESAADRDNHRHRHRFRAHAQDRAVIYASSSFCSLNVCGLFNDGTALWRDVNTSASPRQIRRRPRRGDKASARRHGKMKAHPPQQPMPPTSANGTLLIISNASPTHGTPDTTARR